MHLNPTKTFVYGRFTGYDPATERPPQLIPPPGYDEFAIEILREFSPMELVGKLYSKEMLGTWRPVGPGEISSRDWYKRNLNGERGLYFDMKGSGRWEVLHFRNESDESGPYVAVALKYSP